MAHHAKPAYRHHVLAAIALFAAAYLLFGNTSDRNISVSAEARFADTSPSGLEVVPASGGSEGSYTSSYTGAYTATYTASYGCEGVLGRGGGSCVCANGLNGSLYPTCACPAGQVQSGTICIAPPPSTGSYTPATGSYTPATASYAPITCWDGSIVGAGGTCPSCPTGYTQSGNSCIPPSGPQFVGFTTTQGFNASGHLEVRPSLVRSGDTTVVYWNVTNVRDCTVRGSNGDGASGSLTGAWDSLGSGASGMTTSPITSRTDYTLFCRSLVGATPSTISETRTVNVIPQWYEPSGSTE